MPSIETEFTIQRQMFDVFNKLIALDDLERWQPDVTRNHYAEADPVRVGTMLSQQRRGLLGRTSLNADVVDFQRNRLISYKGIYIRYPFQRTIRTETVGGGVTKVMDELTFKTGCLFWWHAPLVRSQLAAQVNREWALFKQQLESRS